MESGEFRVRGKEMVDYIANYLDTIHQRQPLPDVTPGYLRPLLPGQAPTCGESFEEVLTDVERVIMPGVTHWQSPHFHAYFPAANTFPGILGDMLSDAIGCIGFTWASSPACTELEVVMMDWLAKMLQLPEQFLYSHPGNGGGVIQGTASEATLVALMSARTTSIQREQRDKPELTQGAVLDRLVAYTSKESHSSVERSSLMGMVTLRKLDTDDHCALRGDVLEAAVKEDIEKGLLPFFLCATIGTTSSCAFDNLAELGPVCEKYNIWMHVDAAYAGSACICPEFRYLLNGVEHAMSFNFNPHKWLCVNFDCSTMWVKDHTLVSKAFELNPVYLRHENQGQAMPDFRHWQIPLGRRFRSLKLWFVLRMYGVEGLQEMIRKDVSLAKEFAELVVSDPRFELFGDPVLGLVCFRLKGENSSNETLGKLINEDKRIHISPSKSGDVYYLRFAVCARTTKSSDVTFAWQVVQEISQKL